MGHELWASSRIGRHKAKVERPVISDFTLLPGRMPSRTQVRLKEHVYSKGFLKATLKSKSRLWQC